MSVTHADFVATIKSKYAHKLIKIEVLDENFQIIESLTPKVISGDIQYSYENGIRRTANIVLDNSDGDFTPDVTALWMNNRFKIYTGYVINGEDYYVSRGIFEYGENEITSNMAERVATLGLYDMMARLDSSLSGTLLAPYIIDAGQSIEDVIKTLFIDAGFTKVPVIYPTTEVTPFTIATTVGQSYFDIIQSLCNMLSWVAFFDSDGYFRFQPPTNLDSSGSVWDFSTTEINYLGGQRRFSFSEIRNTVKIFGDNIAGTLVTATASDTAVDSPTAVALIGERVLVIEDTNIYNISLAADRASFELQKSISMIETINMNAIVVDIIYPDDVITITDSAISLTGDRYLVKSVSFPLTTDGTMSLSLWKQRSLS